MFHDPAITLTLTRASNSPAQAPRINDPRGLIFFMKCAIVAGYKSLIVDKAIMLNLEQKKPIQPEVISAIFSIVFLTAFIMVNFLAGFVLPLYLLAAGVVFILTVAYPASGLFVLVFLTMIFERFFTLAPLVIGKAEYKIFLPDIIILGMLLGLFFKYFRKDGKSSRKIQAADIILATFMGLNILYYFLSVYIFNSDAYLSFSSLKNYVFYGLLYFLTYLAIDNRERLKYFFKFYFTGAVLILGFVAFGIFNGEGLWTEFTPLSTEGVRILAFPHGLYLSLIFIPILLFGIFRRKRYLFFLELFFLVGIIGTMMRHLWVALMLAFGAVYYFLKKEQRTAIRKLIGKIFFSFAIFGLLFFYLALMSPQSKLNDLFSGVGQALSQRGISIANANQDDSFIWRTIVWKSVWEKYQKNLIFGIGTGQVVSIENGTYHAFVEVRNAHNSFLAILVQFGILGFGLFCAFVWMHLAMLIRADDFSYNFYKLALFSVLVIYLVAFAFQPYLETNLLSMFFWIGLGLIRSMQKEGKNYENFGDK